MHNNKINGDFFDGIYATRLADFIEIPIRGDDIELPPAYLDYNAMVRHQFVERNNQFLQYRLIFYRRRTYHVALPAPAFFDFQAKGRYVITSEEVTKYERRTEAARVQAAPRLQAAARQAIADASQYDPSFNFGYPPGHPWA